MTPTLTAQGCGEGAEAHPSVVLGWAGHSVQGLWTHVPPGLTKSRVQICPDHVQLCFKLKRPTWPGSWTAQAEAKSEHPVITGSPGTALPGVSLGV